MKSNKSVYTTYLLWLFGGFFGLHHLYLGRDRHAFTWWCTLGGVFGMGWLRDFWRIPEYVEDANETSEFIEYYITRVQLEKQPKFNATRFAGEMILGTLFGYLTRLAMPEDLIGVHPYRVLLILVPFAVAIGVHCVGNIGRETGRIWWAVLGSYLCFPLYRFNPSGISYSAVSAAVMFNWMGKDFRRKPRKQRGFCKRIVLLSMSILIYSSLWTSFVFWNGTVTYGTGETVKIHEAVKHFFRSPAWQNFQRAMIDVYQHAQKHGWSSVYDVLLEQFDPLGEIHALKVLGLGKNASQDNVKKTCRSLSKRWHPDKHHNAKDKKEAEKKFIEIQDACLTLSSLKSKRAARSQRA